MKNYRLSSYCIFTELEDTDKKYMLIHGYTGAIDIVGNAVAEYLKSTESFEEEAFPFSKKTLEALTKRGYLTEKSEQEEREFVKRMAETLHRKAKLFKNFGFVVSYDCNFRCPYCFENTISGNGRQWSKQVLTKELVDRAYTVMEEIEPQREFVQKTIMLYGGEPLLVENREVVEYLVQKGRDRGYCFYAITNGYDLDAFEDLLGKDLIQSLQITIDGLAEKHDRRRFHYLEKKSFDRIVRNIGIALKKDVFVNIRVNTDNTNLNELKKLREFFDTLGYGTNPGFNIYSALLDGEAENKNILQAEELGQKIKQIELEDKVECQDEWIRTKLLKAIKENKAIDMQSIRCTSQSGSYIFDSYGDIYNCFEVVGNPQYIIGSYRDKLNWRDGERCKWQNANILTNTNCNTCKYALLCGGPCLAKTFRGPEVTEKHCHDFKTFFKMAVNKAYKSQQM